MNRLLFSVLFLSAGLPAFAGDLGISISVGQPGFYGQINIGNVPQPQLVYPQPVLVRPVQEFVDAPPIYLHVPPGHEKHWSRHCAEYNACGRQVYFVRDDWYQREYVPRHQHEGHGESDEHGHGRGHDEEHGHDHGHD